MLRSLPRLRRGLVAALFILASTIVPRPASAIIMECGTFWVFSRNCTYVCHACYNAVTGEVIGDVRCTDYCTDVRIV